MRCDEKEQEHRTWLDEKILNYSTGHFTFNPSQQRLYYSLTIIIMMIFMGISSQHGSVNLFHFEYWISNELTDCKKRTNWLRTSTKSGVVRSTSICDVSGFGIKKTARSVLLLNNSKPRLKFTIVGRVPCPGGRLLLLSHVTIRLGLVLFYRTLGPFITVEKFNRFRCQHLFSIKRFRGDIRLSPGPSVRFKCKLVVKTGPLPKITPVFLFLLRVK